MTPYRNPVHVRPSAPPVFPTKPNSFQEKQTTCPAANRCAWVVTQNAMRIGIALLGSLLAIMGFAAPDYLGLGAPSPDHDWYGADMELMAGVLRSPEISLPRLSDAGSATYIARVINPANFSLYRNTRLPIGTRISDFLKFQGAVRDILMRYTADANRGIDLHREVAVLMCHMLSTSTQGIALVDEFVPALPEDDTYAIRMDGLKKFMHSLVLIFSAAEQSLSETKFYSKEDLSALLRAMDDSLPSLLPSFSDADRKEFSRKLSARATQFTSSHDKEAIIRMITTFHRAPSLK
ncbi:MAG: hypothetical protein RLZZ15_4655 [Verrucomicrobiota bacterium]